MLHWQAAKMHAYQAGLIFCSVTIAADEICRLAMNIHEQLLPLIYLSILYGNAEASI